jgi:DNA-binding winged helix-turn-helix (wHTH) protein
MFKKINRQFAFGPFLLSVTDRVLSCDGREIKLEPRAFDVLVFFISHPGELVNREEIKLEVWGTSHLDDNNVDQRIAAVRRALRQGDDPREYIHNNRGHGWCFKADVIKLQDNPAQEIPLTPTAPPTTESAVSSRVIAQQPFAPWYGILALVLVALAAAVLFAARGSPPPNFQPLEVQYFRLTTDGAHKDGPLVSDGRYVYFTEGATEALNRLAAAIPVGGGDILYPRSPLDPLLSIRPRRYWASRKRLWICSTADGGPTAIPRSSSGGRRRASPRKPLTYPGMPAFPQMEGPSSMLFQRRGEMA